MTNILIVDDEILVRLSLKTLIPWSEHGFRIAGEAQNGREALAIMERENCNIVLTDIRMPEMDGLDLICQIRERWPFAKCVILSNHNDFEYVQQALRLGAVDYLLKLAWVPEELLEKCYRLREELRREEQQLEEQHRLASKMERLSREAKEKLLRNLLIKIASKMEIVSSTKDVEFEFLPFGYQVAFVSVDQYETVLEETRFQSEQLLSYTVANILNEILKKHGGGELVEVDCGHYAVISSVLSDHMVTQMKEASGTFAKVSLSFGISRVQHEVWNLHEAFREAQAALRKRFYRGSGTTLYAEDDSDTETGQLARLGLANEELWQKLFETRQTEAVLEELEKRYAEWSASEHVPPEAVRDELLHILYLFNTALESGGKDLYSVPAYQDQYPFDIIRNGETIRDIYEWFRGWMAQTLAYIKMAAGAKYRLEIQAVLDIIHKEYQTPLKVSEIAKRVGFAENYLSVLFRKETGDKIVDTLTAVRMKKARELLKDPTYKIYEISEMVGYGDSNHFSKYFKKIEGIFPLEFRKLHTRKQ